MSDFEWLVINYNLPTEPSRHRVSTWRRLKKLGAVNVQQSMWMLPKSQENYEELERISNEIELNSGEALLMETGFFHQHHEARVIEQFNQMRTEEYGEFSSECEKYLKELEKEIRIQKFTYAELEEEEEEYHKLATWFARILKRDKFQAPAGIPARELAKRIEKEFEVFGTLVFEYNEGMKRE